MKTRTLKAILSAEEEFFDKVWYDRKGFIIEEIRQGKKIPPDIEKGMYSAMAKCVKKYGKENLGPYTDFQWGMINGKLSAIRWMLGEDWDMLDT